MSTPLRVHSGDGGGYLVLIEVPGEGIYFARGTSVPSDGATGFAKGCIFVDVDAAAGSIFFGNEGTVSSADFDAISVA